MTLTFGGYTIGSPATATVTIKNDDATVTVAATDATAGWVSWISSIGYRCMFALGLRRFCFFCERIT